MHYVFERDGIRTYVPCTPATRSRAQRAYRDQNWVEFDPSMLGISLVNPYKQGIVEVTQQYVQKPECACSQVSAIVTLFVILALMGLAGGVECGLIFS